MEIRNFPGCCGANVLVGFGNPTDKASYLKLQTHPKEHIYSYQSMQYLETTNEEQFDKLVKNLKPLDDPSTVGRLTFAILADYQLARYEGFWGKKLKEAGFNPVSRWFNSSGGPCTLFLRLPTEASRELSEIPNWSKE